MVAVGSVVVIGALPGCGPDDVTGVSDDDLFGAWTMVSTGGQSLPASVTIDDCVHTIISEDITFNSDLTFAVTSVTSIACAGQNPEPTTELASGTFSVRNGRLFLLFSGEFVERSAPIGVTSSRLTLTIVEDGQTSLIIYERQ